MLLAGANAVPIADASDRETWLQARKRHLTASEVAAVLGLAPGRGKVVRAKAGTETAAELLEEGPDDLAQVAAGRHLERGVFEWFKSETPHVQAEMCGWLLWSPKTHPGLAATPDAIMDGEPVEIKCVGESSLANWHECQDLSGWEKLALPLPRPTYVRQRLPRENNRTKLGACDPRSEWRRSRGYQLGVILPTLGEPLVPLKYWVQLQVQMFVLDASAGWLVGLVGGTRRYDFLYERDAAFEAVVIAETERFWQDVQREKDKCQKSNQI
jgi:hypothetical protein